MLDAPFIYRLGHSALIRLLRPSTKATAVLLALLAAGCLGRSGSDAPPDETARGPPSSADDVAQIQAQLSAPRFEGVLTSEEYLEASDGTWLRVRLFQPAGAEDVSTPVILVVSPYFGQYNPFNLVPVEGVAPWLIEHFVPRGYTVALADVRGTGESGGCIDHTGLREAEDGYEVVEHLAALPGMNGRVGMVGLSYDAEVQQATATLAPPHLTTIVPASSIASLYDHVYFDGVPYRTQGSAGAASYAAQGMAPPSPPAGPAGANPHSPGVWTERGECQATNLAARSDPRGAWNDYWQEREIRDRVANVQATSVFFIHGLEDWNVHPRHIEGWFNEIPAPKRAWLGQWDHNFPDQNGYRAEWTRADWRFALHRWMDHWLLGIDTGLLAEPAVQVQDSTGRWRTEDAWPPVGLEDRSWYLAGGGSLAAEPASAGEVEYRDTNLPIENGGGAVAFLSEPLAAPLHYAGTPTLSFVATLDQPSTHFAAHLVDVAPDGSESVINRGYLDAAHRAGRGDIEPVDPGTGVAYTVRFYPQDDVVDAGHRLLLRIGASDDATQPDGTLAVVRIQWSASEPATLRLPVVEDAATRAFAPPEL